MNNKPIKSIAIIHIFIFALFFLGCGGTSSDKFLKTSSGNNSSITMGKIQGTVVSSDTKLGLAGAIVEAYQSQAITDNEGNYLLENIPAGDHNVTVRLTGYSAAVLKDVRVFSGQITEKINFALDYASGQYTSDFQVLSINPYWGTDGDQLTILCSGCGTIPGRVTVNGADAAIVDWNSKNDGRIKILLPNNVESGPVKVIINGETSKELNPINFIGKPVILSINPEIASGGQTISVHGRNFSPIYSDNRFQLNGIDCFTLQDDATISNLKVTLPANARTGNLTVKIINQAEYSIEGINSALVTVAPKLVYITPKRSLPGVPITLYGYNFGSVKSMFKVLLGTYEISDADITSFSDTCVTFNAPSNSILSAGSTVKVCAMVNSAKSNELEYTAYNNVGTTLSKYGIYDFNEVSDKGKLKLAQLKPNENLIFISTLTGGTGEASQDVLDGDYSYVVSASLGGNINQIPTLPSSVRASEFAKQFSNQLPANSNSFKNSNSPINEKSKDVRASIDEPASDTVSFYVRDFTSSNPYDAANDILQNGILAASSAHALIYLEESVSGITQVACEEIAKEFDNTYDAITAEFGVLVPPEGNVDTQERIAIFLTDKVDNKPDKAAYFDSRDKSLQKVNTNGTEIIFVSPNSYKASESEFHGELASALHDMIYYNQRWDTPGVAYYGTDWQCAGLSMLARQTAGYGYSQKNTNAVSKVKAYLQNPEKYNLNRWPEVVSDGNYGLQFLFTQYLYDRCKGKSTVTILESGRSSNVYKGLKDIELNVLPDANPTTNTLSDFFNDFCLALFCDKLGFKEDFPGYDSQRYSFKNISLRTNGVTGLRGKTLTENPTNMVVYPVPGWGCSVLAYSGGNNGDLEFEIKYTPDTGIFKTWVIYYSNDSLVSSN